MDRRDLLKQTLLAAAGASVANGARTTLSSGTSPLLQTPPIPPTPVTLKAYRFDHIGVCCSATDAESARKYFEQYCFEVVSPEEVEELTGWELNHRVHFLGTDEYPFESWNSFGGELEVRGKAGMSEPAGFYDDIVLPPFDPRENQPWNFCPKGSNTPSAGDLVWTTDGKTVRRGKWHPHETCLFDFEDWLPGDWKDKFGDRIPVVTAWLEYNNSREVPAPPGNRLS